MNLKFAFPALLLSVSWTVAALAVEKDSTVRELAPGVTITDQPNLSSESPVRESLPEEPSPEEPSPVQLSPEMEARQHRIQRVLETYAEKKLNTRDHTPWEVMHAIIAYGVDAEIRVGGPQGQPQTAIGWICYNNTFKGHRLMQLRRGLPYAIRDVDLQGHHGQLLAILAQSRLRKDYPIRVAGKPFTIEDLIECEMRTCRQGDEQTFKLISLMHYLPSTARWKSEDGQIWSIQRLIHDELASPVKGAACGGTHRLMGLSYAVRQREERGEPMTGEFARAQRYINSYHQYALSLQNSDGSFSTKWLERREARPDIDRRLQTSGHILEWLLFSLPREELHDPQVVKAVDYITTLLTQHRHRQWEIGPQGHAIHALQLYKMRVFENREAELLAGKDQASRSKAQESEDEVETPEPEVPAARVADQVEPVTVPVEKPAAQDSTPQTVSQGPQERAPPAGTEDKASPADESARQAKKPKQPAAPQGPILLPPLR